MLLAAFSFSLNNPVQEQSVVISRIDGVNPSLVCVTLGGKVFIYTPKGSANITEKHEHHFLNLNKKIQCLTAGAFD